MVRDGILNYIAHNRVAQIQVKKLVNIIGK